MPSDQCNSTMDCWARWNAYVFAHDAFHQINFLPNVLYHRITKYSAAKISAYTVLYVLWYVKRPLSMSNSKHVALVKDGVTHGGKLCKSLWMSMNAYYWRNLNMWLSVFPYLCTLLRGIGVVPSRCGNLTDEAASNFLPLCWLNILLCEAGLARLHLVVLLLTM